MSIDDSEIERSGNEVTHAKLPVPDVLADYKDIEKVDIEVVDFDDFLGSVIESGASKLENVFYSDFGPSLTMCTVGAHRSVVGGTLLSLVGVEGMGEGTDLSDGSSIMALPTIFEGMHADERGILVSADGTKRLKTFVFFGDLQDGNYAKKLALPGVLTPPISDSSVFLPAMYIARREAFGTQLVVVNTSHEDLSLIVEKQDALRRAFADRQAEVEKVIDLASKSV